MKKRKAVFFLPLLIFAGLAAHFICVYYHADSTALAALESDETVTVEKTAEGWLFDGPSEDTALIFYPGAKVEETAYAPLLRMLAESGIDAFLIKMPIRLAFLGVKKAEAVQQAYSYETWYIGGHSVGGVAASWYAADHGSGVDGLILCAAYTTKPIDPGLPVVSIYGSRDGVLNMDHYEAGKKYLPADTVEYRIEGGNHSQFGSYRTQFGDGVPDITAEEQQRETADCILSALLPSAVSPENQDGFALVDIPPDSPGAKGTAEQGANTQHPETIETGETGETENSGGADVNGETENPGGLDVNGETENPGAANLNIELRDVDGDGKNYVFSYGGEEFKAQYTTDNWKIIDSYKITERTDITAICQALLDVHPVHGRDMQSFRTAEDMAYEWQLHSFAYAFLPEDNPLRKNAKDVDLDPADQGRTLEEIYKDRTGMDLQLGEMMR